MRTLQRNTITVQINHVGIAPASLRNASLYAWVLFTQFTSGNVLLNGVFGLYLYLYLYGDARW